MEQPQVHQEYVKHSLKNEITLHSNYLMQNFDYYLHTTSIHFPYYFTYDGFNIAVVGFKLKTIKLSFNRQLDYFDCCLFIKEILEGLNSITSICYQIHGAEVLHLE